MLALWWAVVAGFNVQPFIAPSPLLVAQTLFSKAGVLFQNLQLTALEALCGFMLGNITAIALATVFVHNKTLNDMLFPVFVAINSIPVVAKAPILVLIMGNGFAPKITIAALVCFFPTLVNMVRGLESVESNALELMRVLSASPAQVFWKLRVPSSLPFLFAALKIAATSCVIGAIVSEWIGADTGLGYLITISTFEFRTGLLYATTAVGSFLALAFFLAVVIVEKAVVRWKPATLPP